MYHAAINKHHRVVVAVCHPQTMKGRVRDDNQPWDTVQVKREDNIVLKVFCSSFFFSC